jgi:hypothetical protein
MEFRILGPFEVVGSAGLIDVRGAKRRALLACLVVHAGHSLSVDRLVAELWGDAGAGGAARTVQTYVSQLRHGGAPGPRTGRGRRRPPGEHAEGRTGGPQPCHPRRRPGRGTACRGPLPTGRDQSVTARSSRPRRTGSDLVGLAGLPRGLPGPEPGEPDVELAGFSRSGHHVHCGLPRSFVAAGPASEHDSGHSEPGTSVHWRREVRCHGGGYDGGASSVGAGGGCDCG